MQNNKSYLNGFRLLVAIYGGALLFLTACSRFTVGRPYGIAPYSDSGCGTISSGDSCMNDHYDGYLNSTQGNYERPSYFLTLGDRIAPVGNGVPYRLWNRATLHSLHNAFESTVADDFIIETISRAMSLYGAAHLNRTNATGGTILMKAVKQDRIDVVNFLINAGANIHCHDFYGRTALRDAVEKGNPHMVATLLFYGAKVDIDNARNFFYSRRYVENKQLILRLFKLAKDNQYATIGRMLPKLLYLSQQQGFYSGSNPRMPGCETTSSSGYCVKNGSSNQHPQNG